MIQRYNNWIELWEENESQLQLYLYEQQQQQQQQPPFWKNNKNDDQDQQHKQTNSSSSNRFITNRNHKILFILDVREEEEKEEQDEEGWSSQQQQQQSHGVMMVHIPLSQLRERRFELPPRHVPFGVVVVVQTENDNNTDHNNNIRSVYHLLVGPNYVDNNNNNNNNNKANNDDITVPLPDYHQDISSLSATKKAWNVQFIVSLSKTMKTTTTIQQQQQQSSIDIPLFRIQPRLWNPDPILQQVVVPLLQQRLQLQQQQQQQQKYQKNNNSIQQSSCTNDDDHHPHSINMQPIVEEIWDLGCGYGRDVCYVAEHLLKGHYDDTFQYDDDDGHGTTTTKSNHDDHHSQQPNFCVVGLDQRYRTKESMVDTEQFWYRRNVTNVTKCRTWQFVRTTTTTATTTTTSTNRSSSINTKNPQQLNHDTDINTPPGFVRELLRKNVTCIYAIRFYNRSLFQTIANIHKNNNQQLDDHNDNCSDNNDDDNAENVLSLSSLSSVLPSGFIVAISHFGKPFVQSKWNFSHPKEKNVLERNELRDLFSCSNHNNNNNNYRQDDDADPISSFPTNDEKQQQQQTKYDWKIICDKVIYEDGNVYNHENNNDQTSTKNETTIMMEDDNKNPKRTLIQFVAQWLPVE